MTSIPLSDQITEIELHAIGLESQIDRARRREIKRTPEQIERLVSRVAATRAALKTLRLCEAKEVCR
jgi:hypothetical protein